MANFSTEFPIDPKNSVADVVRLALEWVAGSHHCRLPKDQLVDVPVDAARTVTADEDSLVVATAADEASEIGGVRWTQVNQGLEWTSTMVTLRADDRHVLSFQVNCEALNTLVRLPTPHKPVFIGLALQRLGGGNDGEIPVSAKPFRLSDGEAHIAAQLMMGTARNQLPIVYISTDYGGSPLVSPERISKLVSGMAHVVVEPNRAFSLEVKRLTKSRNAFGGTVGVYWPESTVRRLYYLDDDTPDPRAVEVKVAKDIRLALANRRQRMNATWAHLQERLTSKRLERIRADESTTLADYIETFDADQMAKQNRIDEANTEIARLQAEVRQLSSRQAAQERGLIQPGEEQDFYDGEIADIVCEALAAALQSVGPGTRRQDVLNDLINANPPAGARQRQADEIKRLFKDYRSMDGTLRNALTRLGFQISDDGKHHKVVYQGDDRYTFAVAKTSSDVRAGKNQASQINNLIF